MDSGGINGPLPPGRRRGAGLIEVPTSEPDSLDA